MTNNYDKDDRALQEALNEADCCLAAGIAIPLNVWSTLMAYGIDASEYTGYGVQEEIDFDELQALDEASKAQSLEDLYTEDMLDEDEGSI
jgi:hypothetical protein